MCKKIVSPYNEKQRNCTKKEFKDGWCRLHHPDTVAKELLLRNEMIEDRRIGRWMRNKYPEIFEQMRNEINCANKAE